MRSWHVPSSDGESEREEQDPECFDSGCSRKRQKGSQNERRSVHAKQPRNSNRGASLRKHRVKERLFHITNTYHFPPNPGTNAILLALGNVFPECGDFQKKVDTICGWFENRCPHNANITPTSLADNKSAHNLIVDINMGLLDNAVTRLHRLFSYLRLALLVTR